MDVELYRFILPQFSMRLLNTASSRPPIVRITMGQPESPFLPCFTDGERSLPPIALTLHEYRHHRSSRLECCVGQQRAIHLTPLPFSATPTRIPLFQPALPLRANRMLCRRYVSWMIAESLKIGKQLGPGKSFEVTDHACDFPETK